MSTDGEQAPEHAERGSMAEVVQVMVWDELIEFGLDPDDIDSFTITYDPDAARWPEKEEDRTELTIWPEEGGALHFRFSNERGMWDDSVTVAPTGEVFSVKGRQPRSSGDYAAKAERFRDYDEIRIHFSKRRTSSDASSGETPQQTAS